MEQSYTKTVFVVHLKFCLAGSFVYQLPFLPQNFDPLLFGLKMVRQTLLFPNQIKNCLVYVVNSSQIIIWDFESHSWPILCNLVFWHIFFCYRNTDQNNFPTLWENEKLSCCLVRDKRTVKCHHWALSWDPEWSMCFQKGSSVNGCREAVASWGGENPGSRRFGSQ